MLLQLNVKNFALIDDLKLDFTPGLNVLTGETGAGKSIIIGAIGLVLGDRASSEHVRHGETRAFIEAVFDTGPVPGSLKELLEENGVELENGEAESLILSREIMAGGRSVGRINGRAVPVSVLKKAGSYLIDLHGQHQHQSLLQPRRHLDLLDEYGGEKIRTLRSEVASLYNQLTEKQKQLERMGMDERERARKAEILWFQVREIEEADLSPQEEEELLERQKVLSHAEKIMENVSLAYQRIAGNGDTTGLSPARDNLGEAYKMLEEAGSYDSSLQETASLVRDALSQLEEAVLELGRYQENAFFDPAELETVQNRLEEIKELKKKYGSTVQEVLSFADQCREELKELEQSEETARRLQEEIEELKERLEEGCRGLGDARREVAAALEEALLEQFKDLALEKASFSAVVEEGDTVTSKGKENVEFMFCANPGESLKPLAKIISGGEMARVMLAIKTVLAEQDRVPVLIFDEVDAGIGGKTIQSVAEKMASLSRQRQVLCVTHSPQIASMANHHVLLYKEEETGRTVTRACPLEGEGRKEELARMLDGGPDPVNLRQAEAFLERAEKFKRGDQK